LNRYATAFAYVSTSIRSILRISGATKAAV
jgi:hypothetical protein